MLNYLYKKARPMGLLNRKLFTFSILTFLSLQVSSQVCNITVTPNATEICEGGTVSFTALGYIQSSNGYNFNFNNQLLPAGWSVAGGATFGITPACAAPSLDNSPFYWSSTSGTTPEIQTSDLDVSGGGNLTFDFRFKGNSSSSPCETADQYNEGVALEYSTNSGGTWNMVVYFCSVPAGGPWALVGGYAQTLLAIPVATTPGNGNGSTGIFDNWANYAIPIPLAAQTISTRFRWRQPNSSGSCCDNWGLDNIIINSGAAINYSWSTGLSGQNAIQDSIMNLMSDTCVIVTISDSLGTTSCSDTVCIDVVGIDANFAFNGTCGTVNFVDNSVITGGGTGVVNGWNWDFDYNGSSSTLQNPSNTYPNAGTYNVQLIATSSIGCTDTMVQNVPVLQLPVANFTFPPNCGLTNTFTDNNSTPGGGTITGMDWDFGDGGTASGSPVTHTWAGPGTWDIQLIVTNSNGCTDTLVQQFTNGNFPTADFTVADVCKYDLANFLDQSFVANANIVDWDWTVEPGEYINNTQNPNYLYGAPGTYNVQLIVTSDENCKDTIIKQVNIWAVPNATYTVTGACVGDVSTFNNSSNISSGAITTYTWNFGSAGIPNNGLQSPAITYPTDGTYNTQLILTSDHNCTDTAFYNALVWPNPVPDFTGDPLEGCYPFSVNFLNLSTITSGSIQDYIWSLGDGTVSSSVSPSHIYPNAEQQYTVSLTAVSDHGCDATFSRVNYVVVHALPNASFTFFPTYPNVIDPAVEMENLSVLGTNYFWDFGHNGATSTLYEPSYLYPQDTGTYTIMLVVTTQYPGCVDTAYATVHVKPTFTIYIPNAFTPNNDGLNDYFQVYGTGIQEATMLVFNRWGENIASLSGMDPISKGWNGRKGTAEVKQDVYTYRIEVKDIFGNVHEFFGQINLLK